MSRSISRLTFAAIIAVLFLPTVPLCAQENFEAGYIVTTKGDTVRGQIDNRQWQRTPERIRFRADSSASVRFYFPKGLRAFGVGARHFRSRTVWIDPNPIEATDFEESQAEFQVRKPEDVRRTFLLVLLDGRVTLYEQRSDRRRFYLEWGDRIQPLVKHAKPVTRGQNELYRPVHQYRNHLEQYCSADASSLRYTNRELTRYVHACYPETEVSGGAPGARSLRSDWSVVGHRVQVGGGSSWIDDPSFSEGTAHLGTMRQLLVGYAVTLSNRRGFQRQSLIFSLQLQERRGRGNQTTTLVGNGVTVKLWDASLRSTSVRVGAQYRYRLLSDAVRPYVTGGLMMIVPVSFSTEVTVKRIFQRGIEGDPAQTTFAKPRKLNPGILIGSGVEIWDWSVGLESGIQIGPNTLNLSPVTYVNLGVSYAF